LSTQLHSASQGVHRLAAACMCADPCAAESRRLSAGHCTYLVVDHENWANEIIYKVVAKEQVGTDLMNFTKVHARDAKQASINTSLPSPDLTNIPRGPRIRDPLHDLSVRHDQPIAA